MSQRTQAKLRRTLEIVEKRNEKGNTESVEYVKRPVPLPAKKPEPSPCPVCGRVVMLAEGQRASCKHDGLSRRERREIKRKYGKHNMSRGISDLRAKQRREILGNEV